MLYILLALHSKSNAPKSFWSKTRPCNNSYSLPASIGKIKGDKNIADLWKKHFSFLLNISSSSDAKKFVDFKLQSIESCHNFSLAECAIDTISPLFHKLNRYGYTGMQVRPASINGLPKTYSSKAKYLNFLEISIVAFNVCNLNQIGTRSIVF